MDTREVSEGRSLPGPRLRDQHFQGIRRMARRISLAVAAVAGLAVAPKIAKAGTPFDDGINRIDPSELSRETTGAQLVNGPTSNRFDMTFSAMNAAATSHDFYRAELRAEIGPDTDGDGVGDGVIFRRLGAASSMSSNPSGYDETVIEYIRPDGRRDTIQLPGVDVAGSTLAMNARNVWPSAGCGEGSFSYIHPSARNPRELKVAVAFPEAGWEGEDIYRVPIDEANFCTYLHDRVLAAIAGGAGDPCTTGMLQCNAESVQWSSDRRAPETPDFEIKDSGFVLKWDSATSQYDIYMQRGADGCYSEACGPPYDTCPAIAPEAGLGLPDALLTQPLNLGGRVIYPYVSEAPGANGRPQLEAMAFEMIGGNPCEVPVIMEADDAATVDDDNDGLANDADNCAWVQESAGTDVSGPAGVADSIGDACQTACANWPAVSPPAGSTSSDFWECEGGTEISGFDHAYKRGDGSTLLTDHDLALNPDGSVQLPPDGDFYWLHAQAAQFSDAEVPSPVFKFPAGNSADVEILSLEHPNGDAGSATFTHLPYPSGPAEVTDPLEVGTHHFDPGLGDALGLSASVARGHAGTEGWCVQCAPGCPDICPPVPETCNGVDDNSNGVTDEGCPCFAGEGICAASGTIQADGSCDAVPGTPEATDTCGDGVDNNCLNGVDEDCICDTGTTQACYEGDEATRAVGACQDGLQTCIDGRSWSAECDGQALPSAETCNGIDDDCDASTDEDVAPRTCSSICGDGTEVCLGGAFRDCDAPAPQPEICNGMDDNCNGVTDEGCACSAGEGACARSGTIRPDGICDAVAAEPPCSVDGGTDDDGGPDAGGMDDDAGANGDDDRVGDDLGGSDGGPTQYHPDADHDRDDHGGGCNCAMHGNLEHGNSAPFSPDAGLLVAGLVLLRRVRRRVTKTLER